MKKPNFDSDSIKGVFFDLYGTLFIYDNMEAAWEDWITIFYQKLKNNGLKMNMEQFRSKTDGFFSLPEPKQKEQDLSIFQCRVKRYTNELGLALTNKKIKKLSEACLNAWQKYVLIDPNVAPLLKELQKFKKLALISKFDHPPHLYNILRTNEILDYFDYIVISGEVGIKKPNPEIFSFALKELNLSPSEVIYIGDAPEDIHAAQSANIIPIIIKRKNLEHYSLQTDFKNNGYSPNLNLPNYQNAFHINALTDLYEIFKLNRYKS